MSTHAIGMARHHLKALIEEILVSKYSHCLMLIL